MPRYIIAVASMTDFSHSCDNNVKKHFIGVHSLRDLMAETLEVNSLYYLKLWAEI